MPKWNDPSLELIVKPNVLASLGTNPPKGGNAAAAPPCTKLMPPGFNPPCGVRPTTALRPPDGRDAGILKPKLTPVLSKKPLVGVFPDVPIVVCGGAAAHRSIKKPAIAIAAQHATAAMPRRVMFHLAQQAPGGDYKK
jgi:hypothetical protein